MNNSAKIAELRHSLARHASGAAGQTAVPLGHAAADRVLGGGLKAGALHEVFAEDWGGGGFALLLAARLTTRLTTRLATRLASARTDRPAPLFWVRGDYAAREYGALDPMGLAALGVDPRGLVMVRAPRPADALAAAGDILACPHVGALLLEMEANPKVLDLTASRRLALAAETSGAGLVLLREGARETPSAAHTRWRARAAPSHPDDDDWGRPRFAVELVRHRSGGVGKFLMEWKSEHGCFDAADHGAVAAAPFHRQADAQGRRAV
ncbi:MAG: DNA repair protein [Alphaproteobacteria bacterium]|nr:DNA repair protein [Alphaproteobacteria bacterium]